MNRLKDFVYSFIGSLASTGRRRPPAKKRLLIVRVDEIGDFMLWRPFLQTIVRSEVYREYEIHFCGNKSWRILFDTFDGRFVTKSFWMDKTAFKKKLGYRYRFLKDIYQQRYDTVINPTFSRDKRYDDSIVKAARANRNIGMVANLENTRGYEKGYDKDLYHPLIESPVEPTFEFYTNKRFTEGAVFFMHGSDVLFPADIKVDQALLPELKLQLPEKYFVVFPGSRSRTRIWPAENFVRVSNHLFENYGWTAVLAGTGSDKEYIDAFSSQYKHPIVNLAGKTSLVEMLSLLKSAQCLLTVDTGSVHLAAAAGCAVFGIFNGSQYKRFAPYPPAVAANVYAVYPDDVERELQDPVLVKMKYKFVVTVPYSSVKPEKVILAIHRHFG